MIRLIDMRRTILLVALTIVARGLLAQVPPDVIRLNDEGIEHLNERSVEAAVKAFEEAHRKLPENRTLKRNLAASLAVRAEGQRARPVNRTCTIALRISATMPAQRPAVVLPTMAPVARRGLVDGDSTGA